MVFILAILIAQLEAKIAQQAAHFERGIAKADGHLSHSIAVRAMHSFPWRRGRRWRPHEQPRIFNGAHQSWISPIALSTLTKPLGLLRKTLRRRRNPLVIEGGKIPPKRRVEPDARRLRHRRKQRVPAKRERLGQLFVAHSKPFLNQGARRAATPQRNTHACWRPNSNLRDNTMNASTPRATTPRTTTISTQVGL